MAVMLYEAVTWPPGKYPYWFLASKSNKPDDPPFPIPWAANPGYVFHSTPLRAVKSTLNKRTHLHRKPAQLWICTEDPIGPVTNQTSLTIFPSSSAPHQKARYRNKNFRNLFPGAPELVSGHRQTGLAGAHRPDNSIAKVRCLRRGRQDGLESPNSGPIL